MIDDFFAMVVNFSDWRNNCCCTAQAAFYKIAKFALVDFVECGLCGTAAVISPIGKINDHGKEIIYNDGKDEMGPVLNKLRDTLTGIQMGTIKAPEGWIYEIK